MPQSQRLRVFKGELKKTTGGLTKKDLVRNKRGKIVSRKKADQASGANNLGNWLRKKGDKYSGVPGWVPEKEKGEMQHKLKVPLVKVKSPKPMVHKPKPKPKPQAPKPKPKKPKAPPPRRKKSPVKAGQKITSGKSGSSKISVSNIVVKKKNDPKAGWPAWAKKQTSPLVIAAIKKWKKPWTDWDDVKEDVEDDYPKKFIK